jgi:hypothetical protein
VGLVSDEQSCALARTAQDVAGSGASFPSRSWRICSASSPASSHDRSSLAGALLFMSVRCRARLARPGIRGAEPGPSGAGADCRGIPEYRWSSTQARLGLIRTPEWLNIEGWQREYDSERWRQVLATGVADGAWRDRIREVTVAGKPVGSDEFVRRLADELDRSMEIRPHGRPAGSKALSA